jgi:prepilin-type N-terminal cleavage/methylation domain-containing protein
MNDRRRVTRHDVARGFTLIEVLLVLAVLSVMAAFVWPSLQKPFANRRLHLAADAIRTEWCQGRVQAMRTGRTYTFQYAAGSDHFRLTPQDDPLAGSSSSNSGSSSSTTGNADGNVPLPHDEGTLPEGIKFMADDSAGSDPNAPFDFSADSQSNTPNASDGWSDPILFYPDGTTSNSRLVLARDTKSGIRLILRGITGTVTVSDLTSSAE